MAYRTPGNNFIELIPKGVGFEQSNESPQEDADETDIEIQKKREEALKFLGIKTEDMKTVYEWEKSAISKAQFILEQSNALNRQQVHLLIADRGVLFNHKYQCYNSDNHIYSQVRKGAKQNTEPLSAYQKAVLDMPKRFHPIFDGEERENYQKCKERYNHLEFLSQKAELCPPPITPSLTDAIENLRLYTGHKLDSFLTDTGRNDYEIYRDKDTIYREKFLPHISQINQAADMFIRSAGLKDKAVDSEPLLRSVLIAFDLEGSEIDLAEALVAFVIACARCPRFLYAHSRGIDFSLVPMEVDNMADRYFLEQRKNDANLYANLYCLLHALMDVFQFENKGRQKCNTYFERLFFGTDPRLFQNEYDTLTGKSTPLSPVISYYVEAIDNIEMCMDSDPAHLSGYHYGSILHKGGFAKFLEQYPNVVSTLVKRIGNMTDMEKWEEKYQEKDSMTIYRLDKIRSLFEDNIQSIFRLTEITTDELNQYFSGLTRKVLTKEKLELYRNELKNLLTELSFRECYIRKAKDALLLAFLYPV